MAIKITELEIRKIKELYEQGCSIKEISRKIRKSEYIVNKHIKDMRLIKGDKVVDLVGKKFGKLTVVSLDRKENSRRFWNCSCQCGGTKVVREDKLKSGHVKSCGCFWNETSPKREVEVKKVEPRKNNGGIFFLQAGEIQLREKYRLGGQVKKYRLNPEELEKYLEELKTKEVQYRK